MNLTLLLTAVGVLLGFGLLGRVRTPQGTSPGTSVSVIIPARNEAESLPNLLRSLANQTLTPAEVIVVDDGSTDDTAALATAGGAQVIHATSLPTGWVGKSWACHLGSLQARGEVLAFLDADVVVAPDGLDRVLASWRSLAPEGMLSVQPFHTTPKAYEQLSAYPNLMSMMSSGVFALGRWRFSPVAFGPCIATSRRAYRSVGGHGAVAGEVIEDVHLARVYGDAGLPVAALAGGSAMSFRMYPTGLRQLVDGWTKNLAGGPRLVGVVPLLASTAWILASIVVASDATVAAVASLSGEPVQWLPLAAWALVSAQLSVLLRRIGRFRWWAAPAYPVLLAGFLLIFARSTIHRMVRGQVTWHDRSVDVRAP